MVGHLDIDVPRSPPRLDQLYRFGRGVPSNDHDVPWLASGDDVRQLQPLTPNQRDRFCRFGWLAFRVSYSSSQA